MAIQNATLNFGTVNVSAQIGDIIYYTSTSPLGGFNQGALSNTIMLGPILGITTLPGGTVNILVQFDNAITSLPAIGDFILFAKDKRFNTSSLLGYYASVNFVNDSMGKIELFSVGSEVSESSK